MYQSAIPSFIMLILNRGMLPYSYCENMETEIKLRESIGLNADVFIFLESGTPISKGWRSSGILLL